MRLDIRPIRALPGEKLEFDYMLDLSKLDLYGEQPIPQPVHVSGFALNHAGMFELHMKIEFDVVTRCARCLKDLRVPTMYDIVRTMADSIENEDDEESCDIILLDNDCVELDNVALDAIVLNARMSYLCRADCRGLCPVCGHDLNEGDCGCSRTEPDERLAALRELLK